MNLAPIVIFAYNRLDGLHKLIESLHKNKYSELSELYVFIDGYKECKVNDKEKVIAVQNYVIQISGFKSFNYYFSKKNNGLANSIINGVTEVIEKHGKVIVLEDDLVVSKNFLAYMNMGLNVYEKEKKVFSICGYTNKVHLPKDYKYNTYLCTRSSSWGWATWKDRWRSVDWELNDWDKYKKMGHKFNKWGGSDCFSMLCSVKEGWGNSWAIRFVFFQFLQNKLSLFPVVSQVKNNGFDGSGTNCKKWSRFKSQLDDSDSENFLFPDKIAINKKIYKSAMFYNSLSIRIWSRLMYQIYK